METCLLKKGNGMKAESVSVADCLLWKWEVSQSQVPVVPELLIDPSGSWLGLERHQLSFWGLFPAFQLNLALLLLSALGV